MSYLGSDTASPVIYLKECGNVPTASSVKTRGFKSGVREVTPGKKYEVKVYWRDSSGARQSKSKTIKGTKRQAVIEQAALRVLCQKRTSIGSTRTTVNEYLDHYLAVASIGASSRQSYEKMLRLYVRPAFGSTLLTKLRRPDLRSHYADMASGTFNGRVLSSATVAMTHRYLRAALNEAVRDGYLESNPALNIKIRVKKERPQVLTEEQVDLFLATLKAYKHYPNTKRRWSTLLQIMAMGGLRIGEAVALKWSDIYFDEDCILVRRSATLIKSEWSIDVTKDGKERLVALPRSLMHELEERWCDCGTMDPNRWVFGGTKDNPADKRSIDRAFKIVLRDAGLPDIRLHDLRHSLATNLSRSKFSATDVQARLGHQDVQTTLKHYVHASRTNDVAIASYLQERFY